MEWSAGVAFDENEQMKELSKEVPRPLKQKSFEDIRFGMGTTQPSLAPSASAALVRGRGRRKVEQAAGRWVDPPDPREAVVCTLQKSQIALTEPLSSNATKYQFHEN